MDLSGITALVTGGGHRVGRGIALGLAEAGCDLLLHFNSSAEAARDTAQAAEGMGRRVVLVGADLADPASAASILAGAADLAPVRVLVNSAAMFPEDSLTDLTLEGWQQSMAVTQTAPVFLSQAFAAALPGDLEGAIVNVTDWRSGRPYPDHFSYSVAKGAIDTFTLAAAEHLAPR
ncbi:MAG: SDR family NAD(P)-dependent oxidoreductase, partial [Acidimicrobiia bacterium]|nr:SDR family NAD(P)-dependent oxidoreductase [Acidimicrobiia bacterium]